MMLRGDSNLPSVLREVSCCNTLLEESVNFGECESLGFGQTEVHIDYAQKRDASPE
jgi:hypothetical protein